jgi:hypothetical protein
MSYTVRHEIETHIDAFWRIVFDQEIARTMLQGMGNPGGFRVLEERLDEHGVLHRRVDWWSNVELPGFAKKLVGDGSYTEVGRFDTQAKKYAAQCIPKLNAEKFGTSFEISVLALGDGRCERQIVTENTIKVFGIGAMIARVLEHTQRASHDESAKYLNDWLRAHPQTPSTDAAAAGV